MQVSSVALESAFSTSGRILDPSRSCLTDYTIEVLMCLEQWLKNEVHFHEKGIPSMNQMLSEIQYQDDLMREKNKDMFGLEKTTIVEHEILKENHETLMKDYKCLQEMIKHAEETYDVTKLHLQKKAKDLEVSNKRLLEEFVRERTEKEKVKKRFEEMKKTMESERDAIVSELLTKKEELLLAKRKEEEELVKVENKYVELAEKFVVVEAECGHLNSLYDAEVVASVTQSAVLSGIDETDSLVGQGENKVDHNAENAETDVIMISDESDAEHDNPPTPRESNISSQWSVDRNQEEQCRNRENSSKENRAMGEILTPRPINNPPPISPSASSSSSSSSDGYEVVVKLPRNWPEWAIPKGSENGSNKC